jgi:hypothetical protein
MISRLMTIDSVTKSHSMQASAKNLEKNLCQNLFKQILKEDSSLFATGHMGKMMHSFMIEAIADVIHPVLNMQESFLKSMDKMEQPSHV